MSDDINLDEVTQTDSPSDKTSSDIPNEWGTLSGSTQDRIRSLAKLKNEALDKAEKMEAELRQFKSQQTQQYVPTPQASNQPKMTPEEEVALKRLKELGMTDRNEVETLKQEVERLKQEQSTTLLDQEHTRLEEQYTKEGYPVYDRREVEQFMNDRGIYDPEAAYLKMNRDEILTSKKTSNKKDNVIPLRTKSRISTEDIWTPERLAERLRRSDGHEFFLKNEAKIDALQKKWAQEGVTS